MAKYKQLTHEQRKQIETGLQQQEPMGSPLMTALFVKNANR